MTTFNAANYEDAQTVNKPDNNEAITDPVPQDSNIAKIEHSHNSEINIQGSVAAIVAKSLYSVFPNIQTVSSENIGSGICLNIPSIQHKKISIVAISREDIVNNPLLTMRQANQKNSIVYIDMQNHGAHLSQESWFFTNISNEHYFTVAALTKRVQELCLSSQ